MVEKDWRFALPDPERNDKSKEKFQAMSDTLYTYLYSISKHKPDKYVDGTFIENWNYLYIDKNEEKGYPRYNASNTQRILGISKATYYRRLDVLKKYGLIIETVDDKGRRIFKIPFIQSKMILPVQTCAFFTNCKNRKGTADDIIKLMAILKIFYYSRDQYFNMRKLRIQMGYSVNHNDKDRYLQELLTILRGFGIIDWKREKVQLQNERTEIRYYITKFDDSYNSIMAGFRDDLDFKDIQPLTDEEKREMFPIE